MSGPDPNTYLGDGAYAQFDGYQIRVYTSDGITEKNEVFMEYDVFMALVRFGSKCFGVQTLMAVPPDRVPKDEQIPTE